MNPLHLDRHCLSGLWLVATVAIAASSTPAAEEIVLSRCIDFEWARHQFEDCETDTERWKTFEELNDHLSHGLTDRLYAASPEALRMVNRQACYGSLVRFSDFLEMLRNRTREPSVHSMANLYPAAAELLADRGKPEDLEAILEGFMNCEPTASMFSGISKSLGRACTAVSRTGESPELVNRTLEALEGHNDPSPIARAAVAEGLYYAGQQQQAGEVFRELLGAELDAESMKAISNSRRLFLEEDFPEDIFETAVSRARQIAEEFLVTGTPEGGSLFAGVPPVVMRMRYAVLLLRTVMGPEGFDLLVRCFEVADTPSVYGLDGLQRLRLALQYLRPHLNEAGKQRLDQVHRRRLLGAAERLFSLEEEPMSPAEHRRFVADRDLRYNAIAYFIAVWKKDPGIHEMWEDEPDAAVFLETMIAADKDEAEGQGEDRYFIKVRDKPETRLQCVRFLRMLTRDLEGFSSDFPVEDYLFEVAAVEMGTPPEEVFKARDELQASSSPLSRFEIPQSRPPADDFMKIAALAGLDLVGYDVDLLEEGSAVVKKKE